MGGCVRRGGSWKPAVGRRRRRFPRDRLARVVIAAERLEDELDAECAGNAAYERYRANGPMKDGRRFGCPPKPYTPPQTPGGKVRRTRPQRYCPDNVRRPARSQSRLRCAATVVRDCSGSWGHLRRAWRLCEIHHRPAGSGLLHGPSCPTEGCAHPYQDGETTTDTSVGSFMRTGCAPTRMVGRRADAMSRSSGVGENLTSSRFDIREWPRRG